MYASDYQKALRLIAIERASECWQKRESMANITEMPRPSDPGEIVRLTVQREIADCAERKQKVSQAVARALFQSRGNPDTVELAEDAIQALCETVIDQYETGE